MRRCRRTVGRKDSSLQDRILVPTSSELVARIRAFSSLRLTPAIDATSLMSSSSLWEARKMRQCSPELKTSDKTVKTSFQHQKPELLRPSRTQGVSKEPSQTARPTDARPRVQETSTNQKHLAQPEIRPLDQFFSAALCWLKFETCSEARLKILP